MNVRLALACALATGLLSGCASRALMQGARTLAPGESRLGMTVVGGVAHDATNTIPMATAELGYRIGVADGVDVGLGVFPIGARVDAKLRLYEDASVAVSADVGLMASGASYSSDRIDGALFYLVGGAARLLTGFRVDGSEIVLGAHVAPAYGSGQNARDAPQQGGFVIESGLLMGADLSLGDVFHLMPEIGVLFRFGDQVDVLSRLNHDPIIVHAGIGGYFHWSL